MLETLRTRWRLGFFTSALASALATVSAGTVWAEGPNAGLNTHRGSHESDSSESSVSDASLSRGALSLNDTTSAESDSENKSSSEATPTEPLESTRLVPQSPRKAESPEQDEESIQSILEMAREGYQRIRHDIQDYSCLLIKRERVQGRLGEYHYMYAKVRNSRAEVGGAAVVPFSVYLRFLGPDDLKGREVLYVAGQNEGRLVARKGGLRFASVTTELDPSSELAMRDNRYPVTEIGLENLVRRFVEVAEEGVLLKDCSIQLLQGAKVDGRECTCIQVKQRHIPEKLEKRAEFYLARVYIDSELQIPIHYEAFGWPDSAQGEPHLIEQYTYRDLKLNIGLTDVDFARDNPA